MALAIEHASQRLQILLSLSATVPVSIDDFIEMFWPGEHTTMQLKIFRGSIRSQVAAIGNHGWQIHSPKPGHYLISSGHLAILRAAYDFNSGLIPLNSRVRLAPHSILFEINRRAQNKRRQEQVKPINEKICESRFGV